MQSWKVVMNMLVEKQYGVVNINGWIVCYGMVDWCVMYCKEEC